MSHTTVSPSLLATCAASTLSSSGAVLDASGAPHTFAAEHGAWTLPAGTHGRTVGAADFALLQGGSAAWDGRFASAAGAWYWLTAGAGSTVTCEPTDPPPPPPP